MNTGRNVHGNDCAYKYIQFKSGLVSVIARIGFAFNTYHYFLYAWIGIVLFNVS